MWRSAQLKQCTLVVFYIVRRTLSFVERRKVVYTINVPSMLVPAILRRIQTTATCVEKDVHAVFFLRVHRENRSDAATIRSRTTFQMFREGLFARVHQDLLRRTPFHRLVPYARRIARTKKNTTPHFSHGDSSCDLSTALTIRKLIAIPC